MALVTREAAEECRDDGPPSLVLDHCAPRRLRACVGSDITTFVPLLALRRVRACIGAGTCDGDAW